GIRTLGRTGAKPNTNGQKIEGYQNRAYCACSKDVPEMPDNPDCNYLQGHAEWEPREQKFRTAASWAKIIARATQPKAEIRVPLLLSPLCLKLLCQAVRQAWVTATSKRVITFFLLLECVFSFPDIEDNTSCPECIRGDHKMVKK
ncbi:Developmental pluripotency-associated protein 2, partial [Galemys pyrenaicus]